MQRSSFHLSRWLALLLTLLGWASAVVTPPAGSLTLSPTQVQVGQTVTAQYQVERGAQDIFINWGDNTVDNFGSLAGVATHKYSAPKTYTVAFGANGLVISRKQVTVVEATTCEISADPNPAAPGQNVDLLVKFAGPADSKYTIDFGDGSNQSFGVSARLKTASFKHSYKASGPQVVVVTDAATGQPLCRLVVQVTSPAHTLSADPNPATVGQDVTASMGNLMAGLPYTLDWGDGTSVPVTGSGAATAKHNYAAPGVFVVKLSADGVAPVTVSVTVRPPAATLSVDPNPALALQDVTASMGNLVAGLPYTLDWGDGTSVPVTGNGKATAKHTYSATGVFVVKLSADGVAPVTVSLTVQAPGYEININPNPANVGEEVTASMQKLLPSLTYTLTWGDGTTVAINPDSKGTATAKHKYAAPGVFIFNLTADGIAGLPTPITVRAPTPTLSVEPNPAEVGQTVSATFGNSVSGVAYSIDWGDGQIQPVQGSGGTVQTGATHKYAAPGIYIVKYGVVGGAPVTVSLTVRAPVPTLSADPNPALVGQEVTASLGKLVAGLPYSLDWGDGTVVNVTGNGAATAKHKYGAPGVFVVKLSADGISPVTVSVNVRPPAAGLTVDPNPATVGQEVTANMSSLLPNFPYSLDWGDGTVVNVTGNGAATAKHKYGAPGVFVVKLSADGISPVTVSVNVRPPAAGLTVDPNPATVGQEVTASMSSLLPNFPYSLDWGDGTVVNVTGNGAATAKHKYGAPGVFVVKLSADGISPVTVSVNVRPPAAGLTVDPNPVTVGQEVTANMSSLLPNFPYSLDWGDGTVVNVTGNGAATAKHKYGAPGVFVVKLSADGISPVTVSVNVRPPAAGLTVDPNPATVGQEVTANMSSLLPNFPYSLDWGDGTVIKVTGNTNGMASAKHSYPVPSRYIVRLSAEGVAPVIINLVVRAPNPTLSAAPNPAAVGQSVTATMGSLISTQTYTLDWGDGSVVPVSGNGSATAVHKYATPGVYVVRLSTEDTAPATVSVNVTLPPPTLSLNPNPANVGENVTASLGNLIGGFGYSLDWGDGNPVPVSGNGSASAVHKYAAPGVYVVRLTPNGAPPVTATLTVKVPAPTLDAAPNPAKVGQKVTATPGNLVPGFSYTLDWGDGATSPVSGPLTHVYSAAGIYVLKLSVDGAAPATASLKVEPSLTVGTLSLHFTKPQDQTNLTVLLGSRVDAALELDYSGQGVLSGELQLDGLTLASVNLNAVNGKTHVTFPVPNLPTTSAGVHTLTYVPAPADGELPVPATPPAISYNVRPVPTELEIDGFVFKITSLSNQSFAAFAGKATHTLIVGGVEAFKDVAVSFNNLSVEPVSDERVHVTAGEIVMNLSAFKTVPLPAGLSGFQVIPNKVNFTPSTASFSGQVSLAITCEPPVPPTFPDTFGWIESHPTLLDIVSRTKEVLYGDPVEILGDKGMLPVFALPILNVGGQGQAVIRTASTRSNLTAQAGRISFTNSNLLGRSQDFRFTRLQGNTPFARAAGLGSELKNVIDDATKYCRPDPKYTYSLSAALKPDSGDLYGSANASLTNLKVPTTPLTLSGSATLTLDLSASQTADPVAGVLATYDSQPDVPKPPEGEAWMGVVLGGVKAGYDQALTPPITATLRAGYTFSGDLGKGQFLDRGWTFTVENLGLAVVENHLGNTVGAATTKVPLFEVQAPVTVTVQAGAFHYALSGDLFRDFGKSDLAAGGGAWVERGQNLDLQVSAASWNLKELSTLKPGQQGGGGIKPGTLFSEFASAQGGQLSYLGNVPAVQGGLAVSSAISSAISSNSSLLLGSLLGSGGFSGNVRFADADGAVRLFGGRGGLGDFLKLPGASLDDGVATLNTLTFTSDGNVRFGESSLGAGSQRHTSDGLSLVTIASTDFKLLGQTFNVTGAVIGRVGTSGNVYALGLDGKQQLSSQTPSVAAQMRYRVSGGKNNSLSLHTDPFSKQVDPNARIRVDGSDVFVALTSTGMISSSPVRASLGSLSDTPSLGLHEVPGGYELTISGGLDTGSGASVMKVTAEALFGLTDDPYFYVKAAIDSRSPIVSVLGAFNLYGFTGGVAYNMKWPDNATIPQYAQRPVKSGDHRVQIIGGITAAFEDGNSLHFKSIFKIDTQRGFELTADGWILTPMNQGVFGNKAAQSRILASITSDGFDMLGCLGPQYIDKLNCNDLSKFTLAGVVDITAWLHVRIADQKFVKIGTYSNPISATLDIPVLGSVGSDGYLIFGQALENGDRKDDLKGTGLFTGYHFGAHFGAAGSLGRVSYGFGHCYPWARAKFDYDMNFDAGLELSPVRFDAAISFKVGLDIRAGCAGRDSQFPNKEAIMNWNGKSIGFHFGADISGHLQAFNPIAFDGSANINVSLPWPFPDFSVGVSVSF